jgi:Protein of unknown function (DUF3500)
MDPGVLMKPSVLRLLAIGAGAMLLTSAYVRVPSSSVMETAAKNFLNSLTPEQRAKATYKFEDDQRFDWHFIPKPRKGLPLREMTTFQTKLAHGLLAAGLSQHGYIKAVSIMSLEDVLKQMEAGKTSAPGRDPEGYFFTIFGEPSSNGVWGYRVEGHHVSQNYTVIAGKVVDAPSFFGSNPAEIKDGPRKGMRVLAAEEDLARDLVTSLDDGQKKVAIVDKTAYKDIFTMASRKAALEGQPSGLPASKMNSKQFAALMALLEEYASNVPEQMAQGRMEQIKKVGKNLNFAWAGVLERGGPHYYRVQSPSFLIEYDNTQNDANHIHSVWRDYNGDFGLDVLKAHYQTSHR